MDINRIRNIIKQKLRPNNNMGVLESPMFVVLLGTTTCAHLSEIRELLDKRWTNAASMLHLIPIRKAATSADNTQDQPILEVQVDQPRQEVFERAQLSYLLGDFIRNLIENRQQYGINGLAFSNVCILSDANDVEFDWAGPISMLLKYFISSYGGNMASNRLFCVLQALTSQRKTNAKTYLEKWHTGVHTDGILYQTDENGNGFIHPLDGLYGATEALFPQIVFLSDVDRFGSFWGRDSALYALFATLADPCSRINWPGSDKPCYASAYVYPRYGESGIDLALIWELCHKRFVDLVQAGEANHDAIRDANEQISATFHEMQRRIYYALGGFMPYVHNDEDRSITDGLKSKALYLWAQVWKSEDMQKALDSWKASFQNTLENCWKVQELDRTHREVLLLRYIAQNNSLENPYSVSGNLKRINELISGNIHKSFNINCPLNAAQIDACVQRVNAWANEQIDRRQAVLQKLNANHIRKYDNLIAAVMTEFSNALDMIGVEDPGTILRDRSAALSGDARVAELIDELCSVYRSAICDPNDEACLDDFLNHAAEKLNRLHELMYLLELPEPSKNKQNIVCRILPWTPDTFDHYPTIAGGAEQGSYYYLRSDLNLDQIVALQQ